MASAKRRVPLTADSMLSNIDERSCSFSESHMRTRTSGCSIGELGKQEILADSDETDRVKLPELTDEWL